MIAMAKKPVSMSQGACRFALPWARISPSEAEPGGRPMPRKSSAVSVVIEPASTKGRKVIVATVALGRICRYMISTSETPSARAARM